jgi:hypothetical protein
VNSLHVRVCKQSFERSLFRLHIRNIVDNLPSKELLTENIIIPITKQSGWVDIDLSKYNLVFDGNIALTLEWVDVAITNKLKFIQINGKKEYCVLFNKKHKQGNIYTRWGSEAKWINDDSGAPCFYLTVQE